MKIKGSNADDRLRGTAEDDRIWGRKGDDRIVGKSGDDRLKGGNDDDDLRGKAGADVLKGGDDDDTLKGGDGEDLLKGGDGDDVLRGGKGGDRLHGGRGADEFVYGSIRDGVDRIIDFSLDEGDELVLIKGLSGAPVDMIESGADTIVRVSDDGGATFETLLVLENHQPPSNPTPGETIVGGNGDDVLAGTAGNDTISGLDGADTLSGMDGADTIDGDAGDDVLNGGSDNFSADPNDGADVMHGGDGNDAIHGGNGDDRLHGDAGGDYVNGGLGGNDRVDGGDGDDRVSGGFRGPGDAPGAAVDRDVLIGGAGQDVLESRFWIKVAGWEGMDTTTLGGNVDLAADFVRGVDKIDAVIYRQDPGRFDFHQGGFEAFDTDGNDRLDDRDQFVTVGPEIFEGESKESITLDVGAANLAAGRLSPSEAEAGPHTLTIWGHSILEASDFVPTNAYRLSSGNGTADNDWFTGRARGAVIDGRAGDDLMTGGGGRDVFTSRYTATEQPGADRISDFLRGEDLLDGGFSMGPGGPSGDLNFAALDDNDDGVLDDGDDAVRIVEASAYEPGEAPRNGISTAIDLDVAYGFSSDWTGTNSVTIIGVTGLTGDDFVEPGASSIA